MDSRVSKYYNNELQNDTTSFSTRSGRNARLYREVYGKYGEFAKFSTSFLSVNRAGFVWAKVGTEKEKIFIEMINQMITQMKKLKSGESYESDECIC